MLQEAKTPKKFLVFFSKESFSYISGKRNPRKFFLFTKMELSEHKTWKKKKKTLLKCFSYFRKLNFLTPSLKDSYYLGERLMVFHHCFFKYFHFTIDFYFWFWKFLLLIPFFHFITVSSGVFMSTLILLFFFDCLYCLLWWPFFVRYFIFELLYWVCYGFEKAFFSLRHFYLKLLPNIWHNLLLWRLPYGLQFCLAGCRASHWRSNYRLSLSACLKTQRLAKRTSR